MDDTRKINNLINIFSSNSGGVLSTITNKTMEVVALSTEVFDFSKIEADMEIPVVLLSLNFSGDQNFQMLMLISKKFVAMLSDLMMLGDGDVDYNPEEHNDAAQEMFNQVLGSLNAELSGQDISLTGTVTQVELSDMEIQKDFMDGNTMSRLKFSMDSDEFFVYLLIDNFAEISINNLFPDGESSGQEELPFSMDEPIIADQKQQPEEPPVSVSRASFSPISESRPEHGYKNINIDMLLDIVLPINVELGRKKMKIKDILELGQGSVVELDKTAGEYVDLIVNGKKFAVGEVMVADENYAVRIVSLVSKHDRIKSLG